MALYGPSTERTTDSLTRAKASLTRPTDSLTRAKANGQPYKGQGQGQGQGQRTTDSLP